PPPPAPAPPPPPTPPPPPPPPTPAPPTPPPSPTPPTGGRTIAVNAGDDLQAALNAAQPRDTIPLQAAALFTGNFVLPLNGGSSYIAVRSSAPDSSLPPPNTRITPAYAGVLPAIQSPNSAPAIATAPGAHHFVLMGLELRANDQGYGDIVVLGDGDRLT